MLIFRIGFGYGVNRPEVYDCSEWQEQKVGVENAGGSTPVFEMEI